MKQPTIVKPVPLDTAFADAGSLNEKLRQKILKAALGRRQESGTTPSLYVRVPRSSDAWVCYTAESLSRNEGNNTGQAESYPGLIGREKAYKLTKLHGSAFVACWVPETKVGFVVLDKAHIDDLIAKGRTKARHFPGWLCESAPMSRIWHASGDAFSSVDVPVFIKSSLRGSQLAQFAYAAPEPLDSAPTAIAGAVDKLQRLTLPNADDAISTPDFIVNTIPDGFEHETDILLRDVHVDRSIVLCLRDMHGLPLPDNDWDVIQMRREQAGHGSVSGPLQSFPFHLQGRVPGVEALYDVARMQYGPLVAGGQALLPPSEDVVQAFVSRDKKLFNKSDRAPQAARLTRPGSPRNQGMRNGERRDFTSKVDDILKEYWMCGPFVSEALKLIVHAAKQWLNWKVNPPAVASIPHALKSELEGYGFSDGPEVEAIFAFITWTEGHQTPPPKSA